MRLKNVLIVVRSIEESLRFYTELFGLTKIRDFKTNVILTQGLVLQELSSWEDALRTPCTSHHHSSELYFETDHMDDFLQTLSTHEPPIRYVTEPTRHPWGQRIVRFYDPDGNLIEVGSTS